MSGRVIGRGPQAHIRRPTVQDADEFLSRVRDSRALHAPWVYPVTDARAFQTWLRQGRRADTERFLVAQNSDGAIVGVFNLNEIVRGGFQSAYMGYFAFEPFARRGYMKEGLELVLRYALGPLGLHRIEANVQPGNEASLALVRSAGFRREGFSPNYLSIAGTWRDHERWAITTEDRTT